MKITPVEANIKSVEIEEPLAPDGSRLAQTRWVYDVDGQSVWVETDKYLMHDWDVTESQIKEAGEVFMRAKIRNGWFPSPESNRLALDQYELRPIAERQGWKPRH